MTKVAIIGAGLSGLSAATLLKNHAEITIFEKSRGVGGRISTRRSDPYFFDHGAQYFTARTREFQDFIQPLIEEGIIDNWNARYIKIDGNQVIEKNKSIDYERRYVGVPGMNKISKFLAKKFNILLNTRIVSMESKKTWKLIAEDGQIYNDFDWVISTVPAPQALEVIPEDVEFYHDIKAVNMRPCFALMLGFEKNLQLEFEAAHIINSDLSWVAINSDKPGRSDKYTMVIHSSEEYAESNIVGDLEDIMQHMIAEASRTIGYDVSMADYKKVHLWKYANNMKQENSPIFLDQSRNVAVCGDWCLGGRVESAFTSAYDLVNLMKEISL